MKQALGVQMLWDRRHRKGGKREEGSPEQVKEGVNQGHWGSNLSHPFLIAAGRFWGTTPPKNFSGGTLTLGKGPPQEIAPPLLR